MYDSSEGNLCLCDGAEWDCSIEEGVIGEYDIQYSAGSNGSILGNSSAVVSEGGDGPVIEAIPDSGYKFNRWNDGSWQNPRRDLNIKKNINATALFEPL